MKTLERNKIRIFYAKFLTKTLLKDEYGNLTGEYDIIYDNPVEIKANVSAARGESTTRQFGEDEGYDRVIVMDHPKEPIDVSSVFWIDTLPEIKPDGSTDTPYDYIVKQIGTSLNSVSIAVSKVNVRE
jgi:hypothetical protein